MITFADLTAPVAATDAERCVDQQLWLSCAGGMCTVPPAGSSVYYFPQGHAEHAGAADLSPAARVPALVPCRVAAVRYMADPDTDEVFARILLVPLCGGGGGDATGLLDSADDGAVEETEKTASFAKTLTQSDADNGGGFSVPRYCAETIFPRLDYAADPPVQTVVARDVHGAAWKFRHIYRGTPRRHLLTTGWRTFVNSKKLVAGDSIVFLRGDGGDLHVGIRRAKRGFCGGGGEEAAPAVAGWDPYAGLVRGIVAPCGKARAAKVRAEDVVEAARMASAGQPFDVVYYPRASTPEFCVRAAAVRAAMRVQWSPGMRFKMAFETEDSSRISWFMGTVASVQVADPVRWPQSPWRLLQVIWDEPDLLQNVKRVNPWLVELVSSVPAIHPEFPFEGQLLNPVFPPNPRPHHFLHPSFPFPDGSAPADIQGARHAQFVPSFSDLHLKNLQSSLLYHPGLRRPDRHVGPTTTTPPTPARINTDLNIGGGTHDVSCALAIGADDNKKPRAAKPAAGLMLFGQNILTEQQMSLTSSGCAASPAATRTSSLNWTAEKGGNVSEGSGSGVIQSSPTNKASLSSERHWLLDASSSHLSESELGLEPGQCKVFVESDTVGRNLDLSALRSFDELYHRLSEMLGVESAELRSCVLYRGATGEVKHAGDETFGDFVRSARRVTILTDAGAKLKTEQQARPSREHRVHRSSTSLYN